jgi:hypothetical protein
MAKPTILAITLFLRRAARRLAAAAPGLLLLAPSLHFLPAFTYWPVLQVLHRSFLVQRFGDASGWGTQNYARLFADPQFEGAALNNLLYGLGSIVPSLIAALGFAVALQEPTRLNAILRTLVVMPLLIPLVAAAALFVFIFIPGIGLLDYCLAKRGVTNWMGGPSLALPSSPSPPPAMPSRDCVSPVVRCCSIDFIRECAINNDAVPLDDFIARDGTTPQDCMQQFRPALRANAMEDGHVHGVAFQNSRSLL